MTRVFDVRACAALLLVAGALSGCSSAASPAPAPQVVPAADPLNRDIVLATVEGVFDGNELTLRVVDAPGVSDVAGTRAHLDILGAVDAGTFGSSMTPTGNNYVALKQTAGTMRLPSGTNPWDATNCGAAPTSGSCAPIQLQNLFQDYELQHPYVQFTLITPGTGVTGLTLRSAFGATDTGYGVDTNPGLIRYQDRFSRLGVGGSAGPQTKYWVFTCTSATCPYTFTAQVKAHLVSPIIRASVANGTSDVPSGGVYAGGTPGSGGNSGGSNHASDISNDGRFVVFQSQATNLDPAHVPSSTPQVYLRDNQAGTTTMVSLVGGTGVPSGCTATQPTVSGDGSTVAFLTNCRLDPARDTDALVDVYFWQGGSVTLASVDNGGTKTNTAAQPYLSISQNGNAIAWVSKSTAMVDSTGVPCPAATNHVWVYDTAGGVSDRVDMNVATGACGNSNSFAPMLNADGTVVVFDSVSTNLVASDTNGRNDVFVADNDPRVGVGVRSIVSLNESGAQLNAASLNAWIDSNGDAVAFESSATNFAMANTPTKQVYVVRTIGTPSSIVRASVTSTGAPGGAASSNASLDQIGRFVSFVSAAALDPADANSTTDVYVLDLATTDNGFTSPRRVSQTEAGASSGSAIDSFCAISDNSNYVMFSAAGDLVGISAVRQVYRAPTF